MKTRTEIGNRLWIRSRKLLAFCIGVLLLCFAVFTASAQMLTVLHNFNGSQGANPDADLAVSDSTLYGMTCGGSLSVIRQGPQGPYYNHQCYEKGRNVSRYIPGEQVADLKEAIEGYHRFQQLVEQYVELMVEKTRAERQAGLKKKTPRRNSSWPKTRKSNT